MHTVLRVAAGIPALLFVSLGVGWLVAPATMGPLFEMELLDGVGLSTQIADLGSFFVTLGACILLALGTGQRVWTYPAMMLLGFAAVGRVIAWLFHGAALAYDMILVEVVVIVVLVFVSRTSHELRDNESTP